MKRYEEMKLGKYAHIRRENPHLLGYEHHQSRLIQ